MPLSTHLMAVLITAVLASPALAADDDWKKVGEALGKEGSVQPGGIYKVGLPRTDLKVTLDGVTLKPGFALGSWLGFESMGGEALVMGDLVLTQDEIDPVMRKLWEGGIEITALHNHLLRAEPATMYMHVMGHGDPVELARSLHAALALSKTPFGAAAAPAAPQEIGLDVAAIDRTLGAHGSVNAGVLQYGIARADKIMEGGMAVPPALGSAIAINFQATEKGKAAITGDFVLTADEVNPVIRALQANGVQVTAVHSHMLHDQPRLFFLHFWADDDARKLAAGLRSALDKVNVAKS